MRLKHVTFILVLISVIFISGCIGQDIKEVHCTKTDSGERMSLTEAKHIAMASECGEQGTLKDTYTCNEDTGTWWIDLNIEKEGCNPACVVNVATKQAEINWRCMGVVTPPTEPAPGPLTTKGYVYDDKLGYGFEYPDGWEFSINVDKDVEQCDPSLYYETYNCVDFPDKNIKKVVSFEKKIVKGQGQVSVELELIIKSATDLQEVKNEFKEELEMSGLPILNETAISVNNISGYDILSGIPAWKLRKVTFFANGTAYIFKYSSQEEFYRMYEETFNNVINSFNIE
jgi:hypothetical protein